MFAPNIAAVPTTPAGGNPVALVNVPEAGVPKTGVTRVGLVPNTKAPDPVSFVTALARFADDGVPRKVATPVASPDTPVAMGNPVVLVSVPDAGVPRAGVTKVGEVNVPVALVSTRAEGVPKLGVVSTGEVRVLLVRV